MRYIKLGEVISPAKVERCGANDYSILSITKNDGVVLQNDKFKKRIASVDTAQYKVVSRGQLVQGIHIDEANFGVQGVVEKGIVSPAYKIWNIDSKKVVPQYLETVLRSPRSIRYYSSKFNGSVKRRERITDKDFLEMEIPFPDILTQQDVVDTLAKSKQVVTLCQQQLQKLDELVKARFVEMFGDPLTNPKGYQEKYLSEIAEYWNGLTYKPDDVADDGTIVLRSSNIQNASLDFADTVRVNCKIGTKKYVQDNDILMCSRNGSAKLVGKVALIKELSEPMSFGAFMMIIRSAYYPFLMTYFQLPAFRSQITTGATTTINQITGRMLDNVKLAIPDIESVKDFSAFTNQVDKSKLLHFFCFPI